MSRPPLPFVSIITVCRNAADPLRLTAASVLAQDYPYLEYLVVDGASTDETPQYLAALQTDCAARNIAFRAVSEPDAGIYDAMNKGTRMATGEWICFMNAGDSFPQPDVVGRVFAPSHDFEQTAVIYGNVWLHKSFGKVEMKPKPLSLLERKMAFCHQACFVRRTLALARPFDLQYRLAADYAFFHQLYHEGARFTYIDLALAVFEGEGGSSSQQKNAVRRECARISGRDQTLVWKVQQVGHCITSLWDALFRCFLPTALREKIRQANYQRLARRRQSQH